MASIRKRGKGSFLLVAEGGYDAAGKRMQKTRTVKVPTRRDAEKELAKFVAEIEAGQYIAPQKMIFSAFIEEWKEKFVLKELEFMTQKNYLYHTDRRILPYFGHMRLDQIKPMHIISFLDDLSKPGARNDGKEGGLGTSSIVYNYRVLQSIFSKAATEWKLIKVNPMENIKKPKEIKGEMKFYDEEELTAVFEALEDTDIQFSMQITLAVTTGMRRAEMAGLEWQNVDLEKGYIKIVQSVPTFVEGKPLLKAPKNKSSVRRVYLSPYVVDDLKAYQHHQRKIKFMMIDRWPDDGHDFVFTNNFGEPYHPQTLSKRWGRFLKNNPQIRPIRLHDLRHTTATILISKNVHAKVIANRLGHANTKTTMNVYGHVVDSADIAAAGAFNDIVTKRKANS
ncbi:tyrosine-type recombinase/integrase [Paenibacillus chitinolyticus]|uniref:tyrosine-type recombinase/integrase n=1 Tax=Paenibacillus chitinolyticus TaxID=79263 RepID=UPI0036625BAE